MAKAKQQSTELTETKTNLPATSKLDSMFAEDEGQGRQDAGAKDVLIPFLRILQSNSPEVQKGNAKYLPGAEAGEIFNIGTLEHLEGMNDGIHVIPVAYQRQYSEWKDRDTAGGGMVANFGTDESCLQVTQKDAKGRNIVTGQGKERDGNHIVEAGTFYVLLVDKNAGFATPCIIAMSGSQFKKAKMWNLMIRNLPPEQDSTGKEFTPAMFYWTYNLRTVPQTNSKGQNWMGWSIEKGERTVDLKNGERIYLDARSFRKAVLDGTVKAAEPVYDGDDEGGETEEQKKAF